jgi:hypothetical protein
MRLLSDDEASTWCAARRLRVGGPRLSTRVSFAEQEPLRLRMSISGSPVDVLRLAYVLAMTGVPEDDERRFEGGLLWLQDWDIWSETTERVGHLLLRGLRPAGEQNTNLRLRPAELFEHGEFALTHATLAIPMMFQWDAHFIPASGEWLAFISHHGHIDLEVSTENAHEGMVGRFQHGGFNPTVVAST